MSARGSYESFRRGLVKIREREWERRERCLKWLSGLSLGNLVHGGVMLKKMSNRRGGERFGLQGILLLKKYVCFY